VPNSRILSSRYVLPVLIIATRLVFEIGKAAAKDVAAGVVEVLARSVEAVVFKGFDTLDAGKFGLVERSSSGDNEARGDFVAPGSRCKPLALVFLPSHLLDFRLEECAFRSSMRVRAFHPGVHISQCACSQSPRAGHVYV
jgi:hypothetical protein